MLVRLPARHLSEDVKVQMRVFLIAVSADPVMCGRLAEGLFKLLGLARHRDQGDMRQMLTLAGPVGLPALE